MCGLVGLVSPASNGFTKKEEDALDFMMFLNQLRGNDSTGVCAITNNMEYGVVKSLGGYGKLLNIDDYKTMKQGLWQRGKAAFGHGRAATVGAIDLANAHPHIAKKKDMAGEIIMAHNGTLPTWALENEGIKDHSSDSKWLAQCIADLGPKETFERVTGPMAVIWYDTDNQTLNFFRNAERPLHFVVFGGAMYVNSEPAPLMYIKYKHYLNFEWKDIYEFRPGYHVSVPLKQFMHGIKKFEDLPFEHYEKRDPPKSAKQEHGDLRDVAGWEEWLRHQRDLVDESLQGDSYSRPITTHRRARSLPPVPATMGIGPETRNLDMDARRILAGEIDYVHFTNDGDMITGYLGKDLNRWHSRIKMDPYETNLRRIEKKAGQTISVTLEYQNAGTTWERAYFPRDGMLPTQPASNSHVALLSERRLKKLVLGLQHKPGRDLKFTTKDHGKKVIHKGTWHKGAGPFLTNYGNDLDGQFVIGQKIAFELYEVRNSGNPKMHEIVGILLKPTAENDVVQTNYVNVICYDHTHTKEEIEAQGYWEAFIAGIRVVDTETGARDRIVVEFIVNRHRALGSAESDEHLAVGGV